MHEGMIALVTSGTWKSVGFPTKEVLWVANGYLTINTS